MHRHNGLNYQNASLVPGERTRYESATLLMGALTMIINMDSEGTYIHAYIVPMTNVQYQYPVSTETGRGQIREHERRKGNLWRVGIKIGIGSTPKPIKDAVRPVIQALFTLPACPLELGQGVGGKA